MSRKIGMAGEMTLLERVARAIEAALTSEITGKYDHAVFQNGRLTHISTDIDLSVIARAALEAMRLQKDDPLIERALDLEPDPVGGYGAATESNVVYVCFNRVIDAALSEKP